MESADQSNWFSRNWKWALPTGCLLAFLAMAAFTAVIFWFVISLMRQSDAYAQALTASRASPAVVATLGSPIEEGLFTTGNISESGPSGEAELAIPISGPRGAGTVYVEAKKSAGEWTISKLIFEAENDGKRVDLLEESAPGKVTSNE